MSQPAPGSVFLRTLAAAALKDGDPAELAARAAGALAGVFQRQKSLVLDVQFTGFLFKGKPLGSVDPSLLHAAGRLIVMRITRVGFTAEASAEDLEIFFAGLARPLADLGPDGIVGLLRRRKPYGVYVTTMGGQTYRPEHRAQPEAVAETPPPAASVDARPAGEASSAPSSSETQDGGEAPRQPVFTVGGFMLFDDADATDLSDFELLEDFPAAAASPQKPYSGAAPKSGAPPGFGEDAVAGNNMFHFFRASHADPEDEEIDALPGLLRAAENPTRFDDVAQATTRTALRVMRAGQSTRALELLDALVVEAESQERGRVFRDLAVQALRRAATSETLHVMGEMLHQHGAADRERILHFFAFMGGEAVQQLETILFRTPDPELRIAIFRRLIKMEGMSGRLAARAMTDPSPARTRMILELAVLPDVDGDVALRWLGEAAAHPDATVRLDVARLVAVVGGRGGLRILLDLLNNDRDPLVKRAAIQALGTLGDAAAVPFLGRVVSDGDEEAQLAAVSALARIGSGEALPALLGVVNRRTLLGLKKSSRVKTAAIGAIARIPTPAAREAIHSLAGGKDSEVAAEAQRAMATMD